MDEYSHYTKRFEDYVRVLCAKMTITAAVSVASIHEYTTAEIVYDLFHVAPKLTDAVDTVRRQEFAKADAATRKKFKQKRFLILKRRKRLDEETQETLKTLMAENERLYQAYLRKEQALDIFEERERRRNCAAAQRLERAVVREGYGRRTSTVRRDRQDHHVLPRRHPSDTGSPLRQAKPSTPRSPSSNGERMDSDSTTSRIPS